MSSDDGWIIRHSTTGQVVLQHYFGDELPDVDYIDAMTFDSVEEAVLAYQELDDIGWPSEYGLTVQVNPNLVKKRDKVEPVVFTRKTFDVEAVQVTAENMAEVAEWCGGEVINDETPYIKVPVKNAQNDRQKQAFIDDHVLSSGNGFKVYTDKAFGRTFERPEKTIQAQDMNVFASGGGGNDSAVASSHAGSGGSGGHNPGGSTHV